MLIDAIVEIPKYSKYKYRYKNGAFEKARRLKGYAPENYGCIINTVAPDGSPMDVIILTNKPLKQGHVKVKIIGALMREDKDDKIVAVLAYSKLNTISDIPAKRLEAMIEKWTGHTGQSPLRRVVGPKEAVKLVKKLEIKSKLVISRKLS